MNHRPAAGITASLLLTLCAIAALVAFPVANYDIFWHLANGREMSITGEIVQREIFSFTNAGNRFTNHEWLMQRLFFAIYDLGGGEALVVMKVVATLAIATLLILTQRNFGLPLDIAALFSLLAVAAGLSRYTTRPQLFSFLALALLGYLLHGWRKGQINTRLLWLLPPLFLLWDMAHGALMGIAYVIIFVGSELTKTLLRHRWPFEVLPRAQWIPLTWVLGTTLLLMLASPWGPLSYTLFSDFVTGNNLVSMIEEFQPTPLNKEPMFWVLFFAGSMVMLAGIRHLDLTEALLYIAFALLALRYFRAIAPFAIVATPLIAAVCYRLCRRHKIKLALRKLTLAVAILSFAGVVVYKWPRTFHVHQFGWGVNQDYLPAGSARFLRTIKPQGNIYNTERYGGYLAYAFGGEKPIFHYNHHTLFANTFFALRDPNLIQRWGLTAALIGDSMEQSYVFKSPDWVPVYIEPAAMVLIKRDSVDRPIAERYEIKFFRPQLSDAQLDAFVYRPDDYPRLIEEVATYLRFRRDDRLATWLSGRITDQQLPIPIHVRLQWIEHLLTYNGTSPSWKIAQGYLLFASNNARAAEPLLRQGLKEGPDSVLANLSLGFLLAGSDRLTEAESLFQHILDSRPQHLSARYGLGLTQFKRGARELASRTWMPLFSAAPNSPQAHQARALLDTARRGIGE